MRNQILTLLLFFSSLYCSAQKGGEWYVKHVEFPTNATLDQKVDMASRLVPTAQQLAWQQMELTAFLHFGINTFTGREWGDGNEDPTLFNPTALDADQWVRELSKSGFKMVILTAKHHDGFCLWPTATTQHSVASSPWKNGGGDVVKELRDACNKYDMKFGVYLSPWDRNAECYGDSPKYNQFFVDQLTELLTNYGEVHEVWFDGACGEGPNGKKQEYDWDRFYNVIQKLQPKAVMAIMGDDVRWVGNERGLGRETEWSATVLAPGIYGRSEDYNKKLKIAPNAPDLGSRAMLENATELFWYPSEVDVSIRPGWFYHQSEDDKVKSLKHLTDIYFESVGYNSVLLLNIPPDTRGVINEADVNRLREFADYRSQLYATNFVKSGAKIWRAAQGKSKEYQLKPNSKINVLVLQEEITKGQRVEAFSVEALTDNGWEEVANGTTVGYKRMLRIPTMNAKKLRLNIKQSRNEAYISNVSAYYAAPIADGNATLSLNNIPCDSWKVISNTPLIIDLGNTTSIKNFTYAPFNAEATAHTAFKYQFYVSDNGTDWREIISNGEFSNIMNNPIPQTVALPQIESARYIKLVATSLSGNAAKIDKNEIGFMKK